ncbi:MAG: GNAT family N-acetyltransferase [Gammaproteobacteria bacterium]
MARPAKIGDAVDVIEVVRQSILQLCQADHHNDQTTLDRWLGNKAPETFGVWIEDPENFCVVEEIDGRVGGVGLVRRSGELLLFYVAPGHERKGLGRRIHEALEAQAIAWGLKRLHLESTFYARRFYEALGYEFSGVERPLFGVLKAYPYTKSLQSNISFHATASGGA